MDVVALARAMLRRWYVAAPILAVTVIAAVFLVTRVPPTYTATSAVLLADSAIPDSADGSAEGSELVGSVVAEQMEDRSVRGALADEGATALYQVVADAGGVLRVQAADGNRRAAVETVNVVLETMESGLAELSDRTDQEFPDVRVDVLNRPANAVPTNTGFSASGGAVIRVDSGGGQYPFVSRETTSILVAALNSTSVRQELGADGALTSYEVLTDRDSPVISISVVGDSAERTTASANALADKARDLLSEVYTEVGGRGAAPALIALAEPAATAETSGMLRSLIAALALGGLIAAGAAVAIESVLAGRAAIRSGVTADPGPAPSIGLDDDGVTADPRGRVERTAYPSYGRRSHATNREATRSAATRRPGLVSRD